MSRTVPGLGTSRATASSVGDSRVSPGPPAIRKGYRCGDLVESLAMDLRLGGKVALVTGASKGIGKAIAAGFAEAGAKVMLSSRKAEALEKAAADMQGEVAWHAANTGDPEAATAAVDATVSQFGGLDILVNNAAANPYMGP